MWVMVLAVCTGIIFLTELTSNAATTATSLPVALAATCAFMLPVATHPTPWPTAPTM